jgi:hypothetical protein
MLERTSGTTAIPVRRSMGSPRQAASARWLRRSATSAGSPRPPRHGLHRPRRGGRGRLCGAWGIASWDPRPVANAINSDLPPAVLLLRAGLSVAAPTLTAAEKLCRTLDIPPEGRWGISPVGGSTTDPAWDAVSLAAFRLEFELPQVTRVQTESIQILTPPAMLWCRSVSCGGGIGGGSACATTRLAPVPLRTLTLFCLVKVVGAARKGSVHRIGALTRLTPARSSRRR